MNRELIAQVLFPKIVEELLASNDQARICFLARRGDPQTRTSHYPMIPRVPRSTLSEVEGSNGISFPHYPST
jgi:hypothetical protein